MSLFFVAQLLKLPRHNYVRNIIMKACKVHNFNSHFSIDRTFKVPSNKFTHIHAMHPKPLVCQFKLCNLNGAAHTLYSRHHGKLNVPFKWNTTGNEQEGTKMLLFHGVYYTKCRGGLLGYFSRNMHVIFCFSHLSVAVQLQVYFLCEGQWLQP